MHPFPNSAWGTYKTFIYTFSSPRVLSLNLSRVLGRTQKITPDIPILVHFLSGNTPCPPSSFILFFRQFLNIFQTTFFFSFVFPILQWSFLRTHKPFLLFQFKLSFCQRLLHVLVFEKHLPFQATNILDTQACTGTRSQSGLFFFF